MAVRAGMTNLISRVRKMTDVPGTFQEIITPFWSDTDLQDILDSNATFVVGDPLIQMPQTIGGGTVEYYIYNSHYRDLEEATSGTARWNVRDSVGASQGTGNYTTNYRQGQITFTSDQSGTAYYLTCFSYDVHAAAADVWLERMGHFADWYNFSADNQRFERKQAYEQAKDMERVSRQKSGKNVVMQAAGDLRHSEFVRVDIR